MAMRSAVASSQFHRVEICIVKCVFIEHLLCDKCFHFNFHHNLVMQDLLPLS